MDLSLGRAAKICRFAGDTHHDEKTSFRFDLDSWFVKRWRSWFTILKALPRVARCCVRVGGRKFVEGSGYFQIKNFLQVQVDYWIHGKGTFTRIVRGYSLFGPGLPGKVWSCILVAGFHPEGWAFGLLEGYFDFLKTVELFFFSSGMVYQCLPSFEAFDTCFEPHANPSLVRKPALKWHPGSQGWNSTLFFLVIRSTFCHDHYYSNDFSKLNHWSSSVHSLLTRQKLVFRFCPQRIIDTVRTH